MDDDGAALRLTSLWVDHKPAVEAFLRRRMAYDGVDDCVQATFLVAWRRLDVVPDGAGARPWLLSVARRVMLSRWRDDAGHLADVAAVAAAVRTTTSSPSAEHRGIDRVALTRAWQALDEDDREALALVTWDGLTGAQAGRVLGIGRGAFAMRLVRARQRLSGLMREGADAVASEPVLLVSASRRVTTGATR
jgi:RNA polymerase sigma-70 factor (ECF subfamily)